MEREFRQEHNKRYVKAKVYKHHTYHPECAPENASDFWAWTSHSSCAKCHGPLYKKIKPESV